MSVDSKITVCHDHQRRTCIQVDRIASKVKFITLDVGQGLEVHETSADSFDQRYTPMVGYPVEKACRLYLAYSQNIGATKEAVEYLGRVINITKQESDMAIKKKQTKTEAAATKKVKKTEPKTKEPAGFKAGFTSGPAVKVGEKKLSKASADKVEKSAGAGEKKPSAAQLFKDLIMGGKLTDDQIFEKVKEEFGLDDSKRGYVKWYRNNLKKQGITAPEAK